MLRLDAVVPDSARRAPARVRKAVGLALAIALGLVSAARSEAQAPPAAPMGPPTPSPAPTARPPAIPSRNSPGKADLLFRSVQGGLDSRFMWWTPWIKGGFGYMDREVDTDISFIGSYFRPLVKTPRKGDLILGATVTRWSGSLPYRFPDGHDWEALAEYRSTAGPFVGGGIVRRRVAPDIEFVKGGWRGKAHGKKIDLILETQAQRTGGDWTPGTYVAVFDKNAMIVGGIDGRQWRTTIGYIADDKKRMVRPGFEAFYVDNNVGPWTGNRMLMVNATLGYRAGFLSHPVRLGRAMGPQGLEYGNPLGFLTPSFNRLPDTWEIGEVTDVRMILTHVQNGNTTTNYEALLFPFQIAGRKGVLGALFVGAAVDTIPYLVDNKKYAVGLTGRVLHFTLSGALYWNLTNGKPQITVGLIRRM